MNKVLFTIFTPTFNRAHTLPIVFDSLIKQKYFDFEWLIVDDGSTDNTEELISEWQKRSSEFSIRYYKVKNGGKPRAINFGVKEAHGDYFWILDSDDCLTGDAVEKMKMWVEDIRNDERFAGVGAARGYSKEEYIKGRPPKTCSKGYVDATNLERSEYDLDADMTEAYKTAILLKYPMAEWPGENFAPEQIALNEMALDGYKIRWHKDIIYICKYLEDGLTKNSFSLEKNNPMGYAMMYNHKLKYPKLGMKDKFKAACQHIALSIYGKRTDYIWKSNDMRYTILALPIGYLLSYRRKKQFSEK